MSKVGNALARTKIRMRAKTFGQLAAEILAYICSCKALQFARLRFRFSCRGSYEFLSTSGMMEYYRAKRLKLRHINQVDPRWFIYLLRGIGLCRCRRLMWSKLAHIAYVNLWNCFRKNAHYDIYITDVYRIKCLKRTRAHTHTVVSSLSMILNM